MFVRTSFVAGMCEIMLCAVGCAVEVANDSAVSESPQELAIAPDHAMQTKLEKTIGVLMDEKVPFPQKIAVVASLRNSARKNERGFFRQLFYFYCAHDRPGNINGEKQLYVIWIMGILDRLDVRFCNMVPVVTPYIYSENERLRSHARRFLKLAEGPTRIDPLSLKFERDFSCYERFLGPQMDENQLRLVRYMYERAPDRAVSMLVLKFRDDEHEYRDVLWAVHLVNDATWKQMHGFNEAFEEVKPQAREQLEKLSRHKEWWVRLYAAHYAGGNLGTPEMLERLKRDENELVRQAAAPPRKTGGNQTRPHGRSP